MAMRIFSIILAGALLMSFTPVSSYKIGGAVSDFSLKNVDGKMVGTADYGKAKGFIVIFTCNHCPFAKRYQERLNAFDKKYKKLGFPVLAISATDQDAVPDDSYEKMKERAREQHYTFPYLFDETQAVAKSFGAVKTPHAFVVYKENGKMVLKYSGAIDDNGAEPEKVQNHFVENAVDALLAGKEVPVATTKSVGCAIKWKL